MAITKFKNTTKENILHWWNKTLSENNRKALIKFYYNNKEKVSYREIKAIFSSDVTQEPNYLFN